MYYYVWFRVEFHGELISEDPIHVFDSLEEAVNWCSGSDLYFIRSYCGEFDYENYIEYDCFGNEV